MKQTAVEWLLQRFESGDMYNVEDAQFIKHKAKEMEKQQLADAWYAGDEDGPIHDFEDYYNETYGISDWDATLNDG